MSNVNDLRQRSSWLSTDTDYCINGPCLGNNITGNSVVSNSAYSFGSTTNYTIMEEINIYDNTGSMDWDVLAGYGDKMYFKFDGDYSEIRCERKQDTGTQFEYITLTSSWDYNTSYVLWCTFNGTSLCGGVGNGSSSSCIDVDGVVNSASIFVQMGAWNDEVPFYSNGFVGWDRALNTTEVASAYDCLSNRLSFLKNCEGNISDTTSPTVAIQFPANTTYSSNITYINYTASDETALSKCWYDIDFGANVSITGVNNVTGLNIGTGSVTVYCNDSSNNIGSDTNFFTVDTTPAVNFNLLVNLTFYDENNPWRDYSQSNLSFDAQGNISWENKTFGKYYGSANVSYGDTDHLNTTTSFLFNEGFAASFWVKFRTNPSSDDHGIFGFSTADDASYFGCKVATYGMVCMWHNSTGTRLDAHDSSVPSTGSWVHYFLQYDGNNFVIWRDNSKTTNRTVVSSGVIATAVNDDFFIAWERYGQDSDFELDEFLLWNRSNFTSEEISTIYNSKALGTPPNVDLYVDSIKYALPYNWSHENNSLRESIGSVMPINITFQNAGILTSNQTNWQVILNDVNICNGTIHPLAKDATQTVICNWTATYGFHMGNISVDMADNNSEDCSDCLENDLQALYIPFLDRPWFQFNLTDWTSTYKPYVEDSNNFVVYQAGVTVRTFLADNFNDGWGGNDVDPRGKKGRENALSCLYHTWNMSRNQCIYAQNHLLGWGTRGATSYTNVQSIHELFHVAMIYDTMFPGMNKSTYETVSAQYHDICQQVTNIVNTRPDLDTKDAIQGDNGKGFGSGMAGFCYAMLGADTSNPTLMQQLSDRYWDKNIMDEWLNREDSYLWAYKNSTDSSYQEGWLYKTYSQPHLLENLLWRKQFGIGDLSPYQNALCSIAQEYVNSILDFKFRNYRAIQRGDSKTYQNIADGSYIEWDSVLFAGLLCDDTTIKKSMLWIIERARNLSIGYKNYPRTYLYKQLLDEVGSIESPEINYPKVRFDNANDILEIRTSYSYNNDTIIQIDGGEERGAGHSQAQGYYLYALGEAFVDYEYVPYEDDVRNDLIDAKALDIKEGEAGFSDSESGGSLFVTGRSSSPPPPDDGLSPVSSPLSEEIVTGVLFILVL
jgi:hypothetical protein